MSDIYIELLHWIYYVEHAIKVKSLLTSVLIFSLCCTLLFFISDVDYEYLFEKKYVILSEIEDKY